ncbi:hypothetical protein PAPH110629_11545 [Paenibacillus phoenicis]
MDGVKVQIRLLKNKKNVSNGYTVSLGDLLKK